MANQSQWYYARDDEQQGPVSSAILRKLVANGEISPDDLVWREGMDDWVPARQLKGLFSQSSSSSHIEAPSGISLGGGSSPSQLARQRASGNPKAWRTAARFTWVVVVAVVAICLLMCVMAWSKADTAAAKTAVSTFYLALIAGVLTIGRAVEGMARMWDNSG